MTGEDDLFMFPDHSAAVRLRIESTMPLLTGDRIRDWHHDDPDIAIWIYDDGYRLSPLERFLEIGNLLWRFKANLSKRKRFGTPMLERGLTWYEWQELYVDKLKTPLSIAFAFVGTHNHFVLDRGGKVFKQSAPVMLERGLTWYEWQELYVDKLKTPLSIAFAFVGTHNHFVLDRGGKVFKQSAPVITCFGVSRRTCRSVSGSVTW